MYDLGLEINRDGTVTIDETKLDNALQNNFEDVQKFFLGDDTKDVTGLADRMNDKLRAMTRPSTGLMATERTAAEQRIANIDNQIESTKSRLDRKYEILARQFAELDNFMSSMNSMSSYLETQFSSFSNNDK
jgi:flagellar hook-associated protein 2